ncbi:uncharacterized protein [Epargyreus clarus]|uniref:uncharacterized protein isoform X1 n=1 Tax=Epargyreus clarus TaxID=520877 RepID=UPI003C2CBCFB
MHPSPGGEHTAMAIALEDYGQNQAPTEFDAFPGGSSLLRQAFRHRGLPESSLKIMLSSLSPGTLKQYNTTYKGWWKFCLEYHLDAYSASVPQVLQFLTEKYESSAGYSTLNTDRSALSLLVNTKIGSDDRISRFLKGVYRLRPPRPRYSETWDPTKVLEYLTSWPDNQDLSLENLTKKLAILLALATAQRVQTLSLIKIDNIQKTQSKIIIHITDIIKTSVVTKTQPVIHLPFFTQNPKICPSRALQAYLDRTTSVRNGESYLWLTYKKPYKKASKQTISRWIKDMMQHSGIDISKYTAHSTRHTATSSAKRTGVSMELIRKAAGWSLNSNVFAKYYNIPISDDTPQENFAYAALSSNS